MMNLDGVENAGEGSTLPFGVKCDWNTCWIIFFRHAKDGAVGIDLKYQQFSIAPPPKVGAVVYNAGHSCIDSLVHFIYLFHRFWNFSLIESDILSNCNWLNN